TGSSTAPTLDSTLKQYGYTQSADYTGSGSAPAYVTGSTGTQFCITATASTGTQFWVTSSSGVTKTSCGTTVTAW
ncbi:MAG TPA: hypothetical protein VNT53_06900, partial [Pseudolysinimonas sp.]|nr:hypothetical protein [Pseudolysinimonas sp.]